MLAVVLLVSVIVAASRTDFEKRINEGFLETLIFLVVGNSLITAGTLYHNDKTANT